MANAESYHHWLRNAVQADQAMQRAVETFYLACDKEVATAASFKALGLDPRDAPKLGWNQLRGQPPTTSVVQTMSSEQPGAAAGLGSGNWLKAAAALALPLLGVGLAWLSLVRQSTPATPPPAAQTPQRRRRRGNSSGNFGPRTASGSRSASR